MKRIVLLSTLGVVALAGPVPADSGVHHAIRRDTSGPLRDVIEKYQQKIPTGIRREIPNSPSMPRAFGEKLPADPLAGRKQASPSQTTPPSLVFDGVNDVDGVLPPDTEGDVGPNHYVQWVNLSFQIYDKAGNALTPITDGNAFWDGFGGSCETGNDGDPIVIYDHYADRWMVSQFDFFSGIQCTAISTGPDPLGSYHRYAFAVGGDNDYPKIGLWSDSYGYTHRDLSAGFHSVACALERKLMIEGGDARVVCRELPCTGDDCADGVLPADLEGPGRPADGAPIPFFTYWDKEFDGAAAEDGVRIWVLDVDWSDPGATRLVNVQNLAGAPLDRNLCRGFPCIPQPPPGEPLAALSHFTMWRAQYRVEPGFDSVVLNTTVDVGGDRAGIRWAELRTSGGDWHFFQEGTHAPDDGQHRWMGSIAKDGAGDICLGYSLSSGSVFPSIGYACREPGDPPGTLGREQVMKTGGGAQIGSSRWGDYSSLSLDPVDECGFWYTQEYYQTTGSFDWHTSIGNWALPDCDGGCSMAGRVLHDRVRDGLPVLPGTVVPFEVTLFHRRRQPVTAAFRVALRDVDGNVVARRDSAPYRFEYGEVVRARQHVRLPPDLPAGRYELRVSLTRMKQGRIVWRQPIMVESPGAAAGSDQSPAALRRMPAGAHPARP